MARELSQLCGNPVRITADVLLHTGPCRLWAVSLEGGTDASSLDFYNALTKTGTPIYGITATCTTTTTSGQDTPFQDLIPLGGVRFTTGCFCDWAGTAAVGYAWVGPDA